MADIGGIQLLPETRKELKVTKKGENKFLYIGMGILSLMVALGIGLTIYKMSVENKLDNLNQQFLSLEQRRDKTGESNLKILGLQISTISDLIKSHVFMTQALNKIGSILDEKVQIESFSISITTGKISLKVKALNYPTVARQIASFLSSDLIREATFGGLGVDTNGNIEFGAELTFDKSKILNKQ